MHEILENFLAWYLAPWRRIGRKEFGLALTLATVPSLIIMVLGWGSSAGSFIDPLMSLAGIGQQLSNGGGDMGSLQASLEKLQAGATAVPAAKAVVASFDWSGLLNGLCLLAMIPIGRMRLRDMGWFGWQENVLTVIFNISVVEGLLQSLTGYDLLPWGTLWSLLNFAGYGWLTFAKSKPRLAVHERVPETWEPPSIPTTPPKKDNDYDY